MLKAIPFLFLIALTIQLQCSSPESKTPQQKAQTSKIDLTLDTFLKSYQGPVPGRVIVLDRRSKNDDTPYRLKQRLLNDARFKLLERENIKGILNEQSFQNSGLISTGTSVRIGKITGANILLVIQDKGKFTEFRMIDIETAETVAFAFSKASTGKQPGPYERKRSGVYFPDFNLYTMNRNPVNIYSKMAHSGKKYNVVVVTAIWCAPCFVAVRELNRKFSNHPEIRLFVIYMQTDSQGIRRFHTAKKLFLEGTLLYHPAFEGSSHAGGSWDKKKNPAYQKYARSFTMPKSLNLRAIPSIYLVKRDSNEILYHMLGHSPAGYKKLLRTIQGSLK